MRSSYFITLCWAIAALTLLFAFPWGSRAQTISWNDINGITPVTQINRGGGNMLFAVDATYLYGLGTTRYFASTDDGVSWFRSPVAVGLINSMMTRDAVVMVDREVQGVAADHQVFISTNNGSTFSRVFAESGFAHFPFALSDSSILYSIHRTTSRTALLSRFNGTQWIDLGTSIGGFDYLLVDGNSNFFGFPVFSGSGLYYSGDYGQTWNLVLSRTLGAAIIDKDHRLIVGVNATIDPQGTITQTGGVFVTTDLGQTWTNTGLGDQIFYSLSSDSAGDLFAATASGIFRYTAGSGGWTDISPVQDVFTAVQITQSGAILASCSDAFSTTQEFAAHPGVYRSTDGGATWSISGLRKRAVFCMTVAANGELAVGTLGERVIVTSDSGASWHQAPAGSVADEIYDLTSDNTSLYAATDQGLYSSSYESQTWQNLTSGAVSGAAYSAAVSGAGDIFIGTNFGVYSSSDHGASWHAAGLAGSKALFLAMSPTGVVYAATESDGVFSSGDGGSTWVSCGLVRSDLQTIVVDDFGDLLVGAYGGIFRSTDGGTTWNQSTFTNSYVYAVAVQGSQTIFAGTYNGVLVSYDGGVTWKNGGLGGQTVMSLVFNAGGNLIAGAYHSGVFQTAQVITGVEESAASLPLSDALLPNYPNPFNPSTTLSFVISSSPGGGGGGSFVRLAVYDLLGREVAVLVNEKLQPGPHSVRWNAGGLPSGVYFCRIQAGKFFAVRKLVLAR